MSQNCTSYPLIEEEMSRFDSISDIPLHLCALSADSKEFLVYNIENNKICAKIPSPVSFDLSIQGFMREINGSQLFYLGGTSKAGDPISTCLLIDIKTRSIEILKSGQPRTWVTPVYFENFVYTFGGKRAQISCQSYSYKFSLRKNKWKRIASLPIPVPQTYSIVFHRKILISGWELENIWQYDPDTNSYESLFEINKEPWKMFFVLNSQCYVVTSDFFCYCSETNNIKNWTFYGNVLGVNWPVSNTCFYNDGWLFIDDDSRICKFDINSLSFKRIGITSSTLKKYNSSENNSENNHDNRN